MSLSSSSKRLRVAVIGSGNWGSVAARICAQNTRRHTRIFERDVRMWVFDEPIVYDGVPRQLADIITQHKVNPKYLPNIHLGDNMIGDPNLESAVANANILVFCLPHQFMMNVMKSVKHIVQPDTIAISLIKGMEIDADAFHLISGLVKNELSIDCGVLMGANIANEVAAEKQSEATIASESRTHAQTYHKLFDRDYFNVSITEDVAGVEMCGTLKNVVAIGAGLVDGIDGGNNHKAAVIRKGLLEMMKLSQYLYPSVLTSTFFESCGVADLVTTCYGGRNRKVACAYAENNGQVSFDELEAQLLGGQKLQGVLTSNEVQVVLERKRITHMFPLFVLINDIINGKAPPTAIKHIQPSTTSHQSGD